MANQLLFGNIFAPRKNRIYRDRIEMDTLSDQQIRSRFRFQRESIQFICDLIQDDLCRPTRRSQSFSVEMQVMLALRYYASGSFMEVVGDTMGVDKSTVSRAVKDVTQALLSKKDQFIKWPTPEERKRRRFINVDAQWPGSTHDSHIFRASEVSTYLQNHHRVIEDGFLLGDSGYACTKYLLTPFLHPSTPSQEAYNGAHTRTRCTIERVFGWWKRRFRILHGERRLKPAKVCQILGTCAILHNIAIMLREPMDDNQDTDENDAGQMNFQGPEDGRTVRNFITASYF